MHTFIAFFRGINVGGNTRLAMHDLAEALEGLGLKNVKTYIQSGNVVFQSVNTNPVELSREIAATIEKSHGISSRVLLLGIQELQAAIAANPFPQGEREPKSLHFFFLGSAPRHPDLETLESINCHFA